MISQRFNLMLWNFVEEDLEEFCTPQTSGEILQRKSWGKIFLLKYCLEHDQQIRKSGKPFPKPLSELFSRQAKRAFSFKSEFLIMLREASVVDLNTGSRVSSFGFQIFHLKNYHHLFWEYHIKFRFKVLCWAERLSETFYSDAL